MWMLSFGCFSTPDLVVLNKEQWEEKKTVWLNETTVSAQHEVSHLEMVNVWNNFG